MTKKTNGKTARKQTEASTAAARKRVGFDDDQKIKVVGEHSRREGSRYYTGFEEMKKATTVGSFRKKREDASELLRAAIKDGYVSLTK